MGVGRPVALAVPWVELVVDGALIAQIMRPWPAMGAIVLLMAFTLVIVDRLLDGTRPRCGCFGSCFARPLSLTHILRNCVLLRLAVFGSSRRVRPVSVHPRRAGRRDPERAGSGTGAALTVRRRGHHVRCRHGRSRARGPHRRRLRDLRGGSVTDATWVYETERSGPRWLANSWTVRRNGEVHHTGLTRDHIVRAVVHDVTARITPAEGVASVAGSVIPRHGRALVLDRRRGAAPQGLSRVVVDDLYAALLGAAGRCVSHSVPRCAPPAARGPWSPSRSGGRRGDGWIGSGTRSPGGG